MLQSLSYQTAQGAKGPASYFPRIAHVKVETSSPSESMEAACGLRALISVHKHFQAPGLGLVLGWVLGTQSCPKHELSPQGTPIKW